MSALLIDGKAVSKAVLEQIDSQVTQLAEKQLIPGLAVVIVGSDPASQFYVRSKAKTCQKLGMYSELHELAESTTQQTLTELVQQLNQDPKIHGILVQSPLPSHIDEAAIVRTISPAKDVDGFHPENIAKLAMEDPQGFVPCTPLGCQELLKAYNIPTRGKHAVVVGRSSIVGKPMAMLLSSRGEMGDATVTIAHSRTEDLAQICSQADILVAAVGRPEMLQAEHIKPGATVIDVGINRVDDLIDPRGYRIVGDVHFESAKEIAGAITPVPGGVGPMTIAMLMQNTLKACSQIHQLSSK